MNAPRPKLDIDATREKLMALGCSHAAEHLDHLLAEAVAREIPAHVFLDQLLQAELSGRETRRVKTSLKLSGLPVGQTLENFDFAFQPAIQRSKLETLATCSWLREKQALLILGPPGVGKTHLAIALGRDVDVIAQNDSGAFATRKLLSEALAAGEDRLAGKRVVIWELASRELAVGDWKPFSYGAGRP